MNESDPLEADLYLSDLLRHSTEWTIFLVLAYSLIFLTGVVGNSLVIVVFVQRKQMRTVTNMFIVNLAVADLFVNVFCVPATLLSNIFTPWLLGTFMCKWVAYVQGVSVFASSYSLVAISLDRCWAIRRPMERAHGFSKSQALQLILIIWLAALLVTVPWIVVFDTILYEPDNLTICVELWSNEQHGRTYFVIVNLTLCYIIPFILISVLNIHIWWKVSRRKAPQNTAAHQSLQQVHRNTRKSVRKMLLLVTFAYLISWFPLFSLATIVKFSLWYSDNLDTAMPISQLMGFSNSSINPILYAFLSSKFRKMFKSVLRSCLHSRLQPKCIRQQNSSDQPWRRRNSIVILVNGGEGGRSPFSNSPRSARCASVLESFPMATQNSYLKVSSASPSPNLSLSV